MVFMQNIFYSLVLAIIAVLTSQNAFAGLKILEGEHTVIYDIVNPRGVAFIPNYSNESFEQTVTNLDEYSKRVQVTSKMGTLKTRVPFPVATSSLPAPVMQYLRPEQDRQSDDPSIIQLAKNITQGSRYAHEAANAVLGWLADNLTFDTTITVPKDAVSALKHKKAFCVGYSNLAVALLRAAGIPARIAHGYLPPGYEWGFSKDYWGVKVNDGGFHAYLEIYYPDTGWTFSDAEHSHNFVDPFHIILRLDGMEMPGAYKGGFLDVDKATFYTIFKEDDKTVMVDELPLPKEKRLGRRLDDQQHAALVSGTAADKAGNAIPKGSVVLWKDGRGAQTPFADGKFAVALPGYGKYRVEIKGPGFAKSSQEIVAEKGKIYRLNFTLNPGGVIKGKVTGPDGKPVQDGDVFYKDNSASYGISIDTDGTYRIEGLTPGQYKVWYASGDKEIARTTNVEAGKDSLVDFVVK